MTGYGWRPHIETALCLGVSDLFPRGVLRDRCAASGSLHWIRGGERFASIRYQAAVGDDAGELRLEYSCRNDSGKCSVECIIALSSRPLPYGGRYWYMHCPYTHLRARKLYKFGGIDHFCHRTAIRPLPTYASQRVSGFQRAIAQRWALRHRLGDTLTDLSVEPIKPKWMRWRTFEPYAARDTELAEIDNEYLQRQIGRLRRHE